MTKFWRCTNRARLSRASPTASISHVPPFGGSCELARRWQALGQGEQALSAHMSGTFGSGGLRVARTHTCYGRKSRLGVSGDPTYTCVAHSAAGERSRDVVDGGFNRRVRRLHRHNQPCDHSHRVKSPGCSCAPPPACSLTNFSSWTNSGPYGQTLRSSSDLRCSSANSSADVTTRRSGHG